MSEEQRTEIMEKYGNLVMLYADHIIRGLRTYNSVPSALLADVRFVVEDATKKETITE